jgi:eukaryotic-like serine/threonine-protein kinase
MNEPNQREEAIFEAALQLSGPQRTAYLENACAGDAALRRRVEALLEAHDKAGGFLDGPAAVPNKTILVSPPLTEGPGTVIGRYKILQKIGEGGCGIVYMAEQEEPVRRRIALKVIKLGMDTKSVIARFEAERQALAMMDHPNIARVLDAGATDTGRPFFVMELVRGIKITDYCDQNKLATEERLKLFTQVCNAIQHAHQKGIIHRDIKPSNILITLHDGVPVPKVIDFGIAKATQGRLTDQTLFTAFEQFIGTPAYMSPEQAEMSGLDVDTRSDIYALGVLLYELLTGRTPFDAKELLQSGLDELRRTIREKEPERPSTRLSTMLDADLTAVAQRRHLEAPKLIHLLRGDLDWIVMKSLEKDRTRRYETANGLAMDIQRYLSNDAVLARPPSNFYRFQKLVRRNKAAFVAASVVSAALVVGLVMFAYLFIQERDIARREARLRQVAELGQKYSEAGLLLSKEKYDEAEKIVSQLPALREGAPFYTVLGMLDARRRRWREAITNYSNLLTFFPSDADNYHYLAPLFLAADDVDGYRNHCRRILRQFAGTSSPVIAERMAKNCLVLPPPPSDLPAIAKMADVAAAAGAAHPSWSWFEFVKGLSEYRQGHFASAADWEQKTLATSKADIYRTVQAYMTLAMAQYQLKQTDEARATLAQGVKIVETRFPKLGKGALDEEWNDWIIALKLMHEAQALIEGSTKNGEIM